MIDTPTIQRTNRQATAVIRLTVPRNEIESAIDPAIREVLATLAAQGIAPAGSLVSYHVRTDPEIFDFEVGFPVERPVTPAGRVRGSELPAVTVARTTHAGPYEGLREAWGELAAWIKANGHRPGVGLWESYVVGPESGPDPASWRTELNRVLET